MRRFNEKVAIVTGGAEGVGRGIAQVLSREGASVAVLDRNEGAGRRTVSELSSEDSAPAMLAVCDISDEPSVEEAIGKIADQLGPPTVLVNNAGIFILKGLEATPEDWREIMAVNIMGPALVSKHVVPHMREAGGGAIVNIGSVSGFIAQKGFLTYSATKAAVIEMTRCMALDLADDGIRVNGVCPGAVWSAAVERVAQERGLTRETIAREPNLGLEQIMNRIGDPLEIGQAVAFLASNEASFITGANLMVDGGWTTV
jgi:NAD(P)-dependent dehydrogenase (short-subunit alcohol dehydrogenase family)